MYYVYFLIVFVIMFILFFFSEDIDDEVIVFEILS